MNNGTLWKHWAGRVVYVPLLLIGILCGVTQAQSVVKVTGTQGNWQLTLNGQPYYIKGLDYGPDLKTTQSTTNAYVADLVATGANTTRTWGTGSTTANLLTAVDKYNAHVVMGFWLNQNVNYCNLANPNSTINSIVTQVNNYKNDPGVLIWDIGNEVILQAQNYFSGTTLQNDRVCYAQFVNQISQAIHAADPVIQPLRPMHGRAPGRTTPPIHRISTCWR
jgi:beta-galactosidase/beta-glucuronidase